MLTTGNILIMPPRSAVDITSKLISYADSSLREGTQSLPTMNLPSQPRWTVFLLRQCSRFQRGLFHGLDWTRTTFSNVPEGMSSCPSGCSSMSWGHVNAAARNGWYVPVSRTSTKADTCLRLDAHFLCQHAYSGSTLSCPGVHVCHAARGGRPFLLTTVL